MVAYDLLVNRFRDYFGEIPKIGDRILRATYGRINFEYIHGCEIRSEATQEPLLLVGDSSPPPSKDKKDTGYLSRISVSQFKNSCILWPYKK